MELKSLFCNTGVKHNSDSAGDNTGVKFNSDSKGNTPTRLKKKKER